ncbi:hypothetical protein AAMO2058_000780100 [Amorphochlora amoebiformis]
MHPPPSARRASSVDFAVFFVVFACSFPYAQGSRPGMVSSPFFAQKAAMAWGPYFRQVRNGPFSRGVAHVVAREGVCEEGQEKTNFGGEEFRFGEMDDFEGEEVTFDDFQEKIDTSAFKALGLKTPALKAVESLGFEAPSPIQEGAIPRIINRESIIAAAQTGTGKTFAYMAPLAQLLKNDEVKRNSLPRPSRPKALVLVPNRELALQANSLAKQLAHHIKFSSAVVTGGGQRSAENKRCESDIDILIATPGRARQLFLQERRLYFSELRYLVVDEADTMFDPSNGFGEELESILVPIENNAKFSDKKIQYTLVVASLKGRIAERIEKRIPGLKKVKTDGFQQILDTSRLSIRMVDASKRDKQVVLAEVLTSDNKHGSTVVFCNTIDSARATELYLREMGLETTSFHGQVPPRYRTANYLKFAKGEIPILVTTDIAARGLDTSFVKHVVLFDFPKNPTDFIHRVGRTARGGSSGRATCLVTNKDKALADAIERAWREKKPIDKLSWNRESNERKLSTSKSPRKTSNIGRRRVNSGVGSGTGTRARTGTGGGKGRRGSSGRPGAGAKPIVKGLSRGRG